MKPSSTALAYPGLPIVFAEGFRDYENRISGHNSIGCAFSDEEDYIRTQTTVEASAKETMLLVDSKPVSGARGKGMLKVVELMKKLAKYDGGLKISSQNYGITTGSSDSGAAALASSLNDFFELNLPQKSLLNIGRYGSETVFRSLNGGLTEYVVEGVANPTARQIASPSRLSDVVIHGVSFEGKRYTSDELHLAVVKHKKYATRSAQVKERMDALKEMLRKGDTLGVLGVMESESRTFHEMVESLGMPVRGPNMSELCLRVELWRSGGLPAYWNVAGGRTVYVFTLKKYSNELAEKLDSSGIKHVKYKIAGGPELL